MEGSPPISTDGSPSSERPSQIDSNNATASPPDDPTLEDYQSQRSDQQLNPSSSVSASLEDALSSLSIQHPPPGQMFRSLASIFQASQMHEGRIDLRQQIDGSDIWTILRRADESSSQGARDVPALVAVSGILSQMLWYGSQLLVPAIKVIADASRDGAYTSSTALSFTTY